jgi:hypothetical protein
MRIRSSFEEQAQNGARREPEAVMEAMMGAMMRPSNPGTLTRSQ